MNTDHLMDEERKKGGAISETIDFFATPETLIFAIVLVILGFALYVTGDFYSNCNGQVVRGFIGLECIETTK